METVDCTWTVHGLYMAMYMDGWIVVLCVFEEKQFNLTNPRLTRGTTIFCRVCSEWVALLL